MSNRTNRFSQDLVIIILLTILSKIIVATAFGLASGNIKGFKDVAIKLSIIVWVLSIIYLIYKFLKKNTILGSSTNIFMAMTMPFVISWLPEMVFMKTNIFNRYTGVDYVYNCSVENPESSFRIHNSKVYPTNSKAFESAKYEASKNGDCLTQNRNFLFWQTAFAQGYEPKSIRSFNQYNSFADYLELSFSVGPLYCLENILKGLVFNFPIIFLYFMFYNFNQERKRSSKKKYA